MVTTTTAGVIFTLRIQFLTHALCLKMRYLQAGTCAFTGSTVRCFAAHLGGSLTIHLFELVANTTIQQPHNWFAETEYVFTTLLGMQKMLIHYTKLAWTGKRSSLSNA
jgi:hypothetical protein